MKQTLVLAGVLASSVVLAQDVPAFSYQWSLSGKQYTTVNQSLERYGDLSFDLVAGTEVRKAAAVPALGLGLSYRLDRETWYAKSGVFVLFPQKAKPDLAFGVSFGVKF